jgi:hypothetical protein
MQPMRRLNMHSCEVQFFSFWGEVAAWGGIFPPLFPMSSQHVPMRFPQVLKLFPLTFPRAPQFYPLQFCPKFNSHVYNLTKWPIGEHICFYIGTGGPKRCLQWGVPNVPRKIGDGPINMAPFPPPPKEKQCESTQQQINMSHTMYPMYYNP